MRVLVLGAGMAGHLVSLFLRENGHEVSTLSAHTSLDEKTIHMDATDAKAFKEFLDASDYDIVINCIALLVKQSEDQKDLAVYLNSYLPHLLEERFKGTDTKVIHISSDGVFAGKKPTYKEDDLYDSESFYGRTKALGELINDKDLTLRLSIIGPDIRPNGQGLFDWFSKQTGEINGYTNALWNGVTTLELAKAIKAAVEQNITGVYHLAPKESISKFDLLQLFGEIFERNDITINPAKADSSVNSKLIDTRKDFNYTIPDYRIMVSGMKKWMERHPDLYRHYGK